MNSCIWVEVRRYTPLAKGYKNSMDCKSQTTSFYGTATATNGEPITMVTAAEPKPKCLSLIKAKVFSYVYKGPYQVASLSFLENVLVKFIAQL